VGGNDRFITPVEKIHYIPGIYGLGEVVGALFACREGKNFSKFDIMY
jgi:hypothetical protein